LTGWWQGEHGLTLADQIKWGDDHLKRWLFTGFEMWGPSWDMNSDGSGGDYLLGQIGEGDEADSLLCVVEGRKADDLRARLSSDAQSFKIRARGFLQHPHDIPNEALRDRIKKWGEMFNYCLFVSANVPAHFAKPVSQDDASGLYSGYLWQCWLPNSLAKYRGEEAGKMVLQTPAVDELYFVWEHTNFANRSVIDYNLDSLRHKSQALRDKKGDLVLVQKSSALVEGSSALPQEDFYRFVMGLSHPKQ
jgi:hypothetical protein